MATCVPHLTILFNTWNHWPSVVMMPICITSYTTWLIILCFGSLWPVGISEYKSQTSTWERLFQFPIYQGTMLHYAHWSCSWVSLFSIDAAGWLNKWCKWNLDVIISRAFKSLIYVTRVLKGSTFQPHLSARNQRTLRNRISFLLGGTWKQRGDHFCPLCSPEANSCVHPEKQTYPAKSWVHCQLTLWPKDQEPPISARDQPSQK